MKYNTGGRGNTPIINDRNMGKIGTMSQSNLVTTHGIFNTIMDLEQCTPFLSQACRLKVMSQHGTLDMDEICMVLEEEKPNQREQIKLRVDSLAKYFPEDYTPKQKTDLIEQLLKEWYEKQQYSRMESLGSRHGKVR